ncbi:hypothetical protein ABZU32_36470 [Sphaerisporangium sp. NPDC005288]|uniref:hypothetical protein n=1 Tax=Sphaerisporangium sp. NPDC005288 TaxID=3155114 RepID=UPI0033A795FF
MSPESHQPPEKPLPTPAMPMPMPVPVPVPILLRVRRLFRVPVLMAVLMAVLSAVLSAVLAGVLMAVLMPVPVPVTVLLIGHGVGCRLPGPRKAVLFSIAMALPAFASVRGPVPVSMLVFGVMPVEPAGG